MSEESQYEAVIGLEVHAQLLTKSKAFSSEAVGFGDAPNVHAGTITLAHPGTLPRLSKKAVEYAIKMGLACNCTIQKENQFDRKNYFYPDLPKGYQITQHASPICQNGYLDLKMDDYVKRVRIHHIHIEEDAGKSLHDHDPFYSMIDLNRAGTPLIEIVSWPDMRTAEEAYSYLTEIRKLVRWLGICDGNMEEGSLRCDANISIRLKGEMKLGAKVEVKNLNSIRHLKRAVEFEINRQTRQAEKGEGISQDTRSFDETTETTFSLRSKEMANDYRYFSEPDLPPVILTDEEINRIKSFMPKLPEQLKEEFTRVYGLSDYDTSVLTEEKTTAEYFLQIISENKNYKAAANWVMGPIRSYVNEHGMELKDFTVLPDQIAEIISLIDDGKISFTMASQKIFPELIQKKNVSVEALARELNVLQESGEAAIEKFVVSALEKFPGKVMEYRKGKKGVLALFVGEVMKVSNGKADPRVVNKLLIEKLETNH